MTKSGRISPQRDGGEATEKNDGLQMDHIESASGNDS
jgi:hypothetical protein